LNRRSGRGLTMAWKTKAAAGRRPPDRPAGPPRGNYAKQDGSDKSGVVVFVV
jgi:hypothetical protein